MAELRCLRAFAPAGIGSPAGVFLRSARALLFALVVGVFLAGPAMAADCVDTDGDGFVTCSGCTAPGGKVCGDCNEGRSDIHTGAPELLDCVDNDCDGFIDEGFVFDPIDNIDNDGNDGIDEGYGRCIFHVDGPGDVCKTAGILTCVGSVLTCRNLQFESIGNDALIFYSSESLAGGNCEDGVNNDCDTVLADGDLIDNDGDGLIDEAGELKDLTDIADVDCQEPEKCDNKDNDGDGLVDEGFDVGASCSAGLGVCLRNGAKVCTGDGSATVCSATPGAAKNEGTNFGVSCDDGKDNDCDGTTDLADADCAGFGQAELCGNATDDDGDGLVDEGFPTIGLPCSAGIGGCTTFGTLVCNGTGTGTECGAVAGSPGVESTGAGTCVDVIDNDCDGLTDAADPDCSGAYADAGAWCSLPYVNGKPGSDCTGWHTIRFGATQGTVKADLMAFDASGVLVGIIENVKSGDEAHLKSRLIPEDFRISTQKNKHGVRHTMSVPMPLLRVTATFNGVEDEAWCGIMPWLDVTDPDGLTISLDNASILDVKANIPLVNVDTLQVKLNGIDILGGIGVDPVADLPTTGAGLCTVPGSCVFQMEAGCGDGSLVDVEIQNLRVEGLDTDLAATAKDGTGYPTQVNTLSFKVLGLPAGGHIFYVNGAPLPLTKNLASVCLLDDTTDTGIASAFGISIDAPTDQQIVASAPVQVQGKACGGNEIARLQINGKNVDVTVGTEQTCTPGDGVNTAGECVVDFDEPIDQTDLSLAVLGTAPTGTFKRGTNRVIADASDILGNRVFNTDVLFALGPVQAQSTAIADSLREGAAEAVAGAYQTLAASVTTNIDPAFVVGLEESAVQTFFNQKCTEAIEVFSNDVKARLTGDTFATIDAEPGCSCDLHDVPVKLEDLDFTPAPFDPKCAVDFQPNQIAVTVHLPSMTIQVGAHKTCTDRGIFGECIARTRIDVTAVTIVKDLAFSFTITETQIETKAPPDPTTQVFTWTVTDNADRALYLAAGACVAGDQIGKTCFGDPGCPNGGAGSCAGVVKNPAFNSVTHNNSGIECWGAAICSVFQFIGAILIEIFTLGFADGFDIVDIIDFDFDFQEDFFSQLSANEPDPLSLDEVEPDPAKIALPGTVTVVPAPIDVEIENGGLTVAFGGDFNVVLDPSLPVTPPPTATDAAVPTVPQVIAAGDEISVLIADDVFNQIFYSMRQAGKLQSFCSAGDGLTIDDLLPPSCDTITAATDLAAATAQGLCHGARAADCEALAVKTCSAGTSLGELCIGDVDCPGGGAGSCKVVTTCASGAACTVDGDCLAGGAGACRARDALTNTKQGACHGIKHDDCPTIPVTGLGVVEKTACNLFKNINVSATDAVLVCGRLDAEPDLLFKNDNTSDNTVDTDLLLNDLNIVFGLDRGNDGYTGAIEDLKGCFSAEGSAAPDCLVYAACLDLTLKARMGIDNSTCSPTETGFVFSLIPPKVIPTGFQGGVLCAASLPTNDPIVLDNGVQSNATDAVADASEAFAPPICVDGLTLGGIVNFTSADAKMFAITTTGATPGFADYLGLTGSIGP